ncbi:MAG: hypothetical protein ACTSX1_09465 [Candidatus Heimdallarchaeaceae archaeon]
MKDIRNEVFVVGYWSHVAHVTTNKDEAEAVMLAKRQEFRVLPWEVRTVEEAIQHAYRQGMEDGL